MSACVRACVFVVLKWLSDRKYPLNVLCRSAEHPWRKSIFSLVCRAERSSSCCVKLSFSSLLREANHESDGGSQTVQIVGGEQEPRENLGISRLRDKGTQRAARERHDCVSLDVEESSSPIKADYNCI